MEGLPTILQAHEETTLSKCKKKCTVIIRSLCPDKELVLQCVELENCYDTLCMQDTLQNTQNLQHLDKQLLACPGLTASYPLQQALDAVGISYFWEHRHGPSHDFFEARAIWDGVYFWLARQLGPIPVRVLHSEGLNPVIECLEQYAPCAEELGGQDTLVSSLSQLQCRARPERPPI